MNRWSGGAFSHASVAGYNPFRPFALSNAGATARVNSNDAIKPVEIEPYVPASETRMPEFTLQAVLLGIVLSFIMCAANIYVGLYAGMTVSAAIPASVISMAVLRGIMRRGHDPREQHCAHDRQFRRKPGGRHHLYRSGARAAGDLGYLQLLGNDLDRHGRRRDGRGDDDPVARPMIIDQPELKFPEGVACAEVLKAGDRGGAEMAGIFTALGSAHCSKRCRSRRCSEGHGRMGRTSRSNRHLLRYGISPMLMAVGFIVGWEVSLLVFLGGAISYLLAIPVLAWGADFSATRRWT